MSITYNITTNFGSKDSLPSNDPAKVIRGSEFTTEFNAIKNAFSIAAPTAAPSFTGTATFEDVTASGTVTVSTEVDTTLLTADTAVVGVGGLTVLGDSTISGDVAVDTSTFVVDSTNNRVGVGTAAPTDDMHVASTNPTIVLEDTSWTAGDFGRVRYSSGDLYLQADPSNVSSGSNIYFSIDGPAIASFNSSGDLNIDGAFDSTGLTVVGTSTLSGDVVVDTDTFVVDSTNNRVGIGTTTPQAELHIESGSPGIRLYDSDTSGDYGRFTYNNGDLFVQADEGNLVAGSKIYFDIDGANVAEMLEGGDFQITGGITCTTASTFNAAIEVTGALYRDAASALGWFNGAGTPEGVVTAAVGSLYTRTDGGASTTLYVKESGTGNTGWVAK